MYDWVGGGIEDCAHPTISISFTHDSLLSEEMINSSKIMTDHRESVKTYSVLISIEPYLHIFVIILFSFLEM